MAFDNNNDNIVQNADDTNGFPFSYEEIEARAKETLPDAAFSYIASGAGGEETAGKNAAGFGKYSLVPRLLKDVSHLDTGIKLFGRSYPTPLLLAPVGVLKMVDQQGDLAVARAAANHNVPFIQSTISSFSIEDIAEESGSGPLWFQLYWTKNEKVSFHLVKRAEEAGYEAIVVTIDTITLGYREKDLRHAFSPLARGFGQGNFESDDVFLSTLEQKDADGIVQGIVDNINYPALDWAHIAKLKEITSLLVILKGVLHPEDALQAVETGVDGIIVSNHGGRQLDGVISSVEALPEVLEAVAGKIPVLFDSGVRRGIDAVKAIALGADAVLIGRPYVYSLAAGGEAGVHTFLTNFLQDFRTSMRLAGTKDIHELKQMKVVRT